MQFLSNKPYSKLVSTSNILQPCFLDFLSILCQNDHLKLFKAFLSYIKRNEEISTKLNDHNPKNQKNHNYFEANSDAKLENNL